MRYKKMADPWRAPRPPGNARAGEGSRFAAGPHRPLVFSEFRVGVQETINDRFIVVCVRLPGFSYQFLSIRIGFVCPASGYRWIGGTWMPYLAEIERPGERIVRPPPNADADQTQQRDGQQHGRRLRHYPQTGARTCVAGRQCGASDAGIVARRAVEQAE